MTHGITSRTARAKLKPSGQPYYRLIRRGLHLGYRKPLTGGGKWVAKLYLAGAGKYITQAIGPADDILPANSKTILSYAQVLVRLAIVDAPEDIPSGPYSVADACAAYLAHLEAEGRSANSIRDARYRVQAAILPKLGRLQVSSLTAKVLRAWRDALAVGGSRASRATANRTWTCLRAVLNLAYQRDEVSSDHAWRKVKPFPKVEAARSRYLTIPEAKRLIGACPADFRLLVQAALQTGARYSELTRLMPGDFNGTSLHIGQSKSGKARDIVLSDEGQLFFVCQELPLRKADGTAWGKSDQARRMREAVAAAGLPAIGFHGLRHTWASLAVMGGVPPLVVARNLGHADTRMVEKHYGHLSQGFVAEAIRTGAPKFGLSDGGGQF